MMDHECQQGMNYSSVVKWFSTNSHDILNISNRTYNPFPPHYQQALFSKTITPLVVIFFILLAIVCYYFVRSFYLKKSSAKPKEITTLMKCIYILVTVIFVIVQCVVVWMEVKLDFETSDSLLSLKFMEERITENKIERLHEKIDNYTLILPKIKKEFDIIHSQIKSETNNTENSDRSRKVYVDFLENTLNPMDRNLTKLLGVHSQNLDIDKNFTIGNLPKIRKDVKDSEFTRRKFGIIAPFILIIISISAAIAIYRYPFPIILLIFVILELFAIAICFSFISFYSILSVSFSDWCLCPNPFVKWQLSYNMPSDVSYYFITCKEEEMPDIFKLYYMDSKKAIDPINSYVLTLNRAPIKYIESIESVVGHIVEAHFTMDRYIARHITNCPEKEDYEDVLHHTCNGTINGFSNLLFIYIPSAIISVFFLVFISYTLVVHKNNSDLRSNLENNYNEFNYKKHHAKSVPSSEHENEHSKL